MQILNRLRWQRLLLLLSALLSVSAFSMHVEAQTSAQKRADSLRVQLADTRAKKESLQAELKELEERMKPENIEKSLAGVGSTRPEELRELRRRELATRKAGIEGQLKLLIESEIKLEAGSIQADAEAYQQSAGVNTEIKQQQARGSAVQSRTRRVRNKQVRRRARRVTRD